MSYKFIFKGKEYELNEEKAIGFFNDEEKPIKDIMMFVVKNAR